MKTRKIIKGIDASPGIAIGKVLLYIEPILDFVQKNHYDVTEETTKLLKGRDKSKAQLEEIRDKTLKKLGKDKADIFDGHITILEDDDLFDEIVERIQSGKISAEMSLNEGVKEYCNDLLALDDAYLRERALDLKDIGKRWLYNIVGIEMIDLSDLPKNSILVANDLTPSDTAQVDLDNVLAFVAEVGGKTSHSSIMANSLELPAIVGTGEITSLVNNDDNIIVDALSGDVIINPTKEDLEIYEIKRQEFLADKEELKKLKNKDAISEDGVKVDVWCNIGSPKDVKGVLESGGKGIGLYRTEFLFMDRDRFPTEDEQFEAYKTVAESLNGNPVTIRTMDIGGDKSLPYMKLPKEENPFLGWRAIRICLDQPDILKTQFRALLRASKFGHIKIMLPMIVEVDEIRKSRKILEQCKAELKKEKIEFNENIELGIMVETPAVALHAKYFAQEVDFFSIGTNDLTQYALAVDRGNKKISGLYNPFNPAVLKAIKLSIDGAHEAGIKISMCGEFAGDQLATPILFGMGLDAFSMSANALPRVKRNLLRLNKEITKKLVDKVLTLSTTKEVMTEINKFNDKYMK